MKIRIGINGMGRIGRMIVRSIVETKNKNLEIKHKKIQMKFMLLTEE